MKVNATLIYGAIGIALTATERFSPGAQLAPPQWQAIKEAMERGEQIELEGAEELVAVLKVKGSL